MERPGFPHGLKEALHHEQPELVGKAVAVRDKDWTYAWRLYEQPELYDRTKDLRERTSLAGGRASADIERRLHDAALRRLVETADITPSAPDPRLPQVALPAPGTARPH
ncbi:hypothetical protein [Streptomyces sp. NPDC048295]|uniref:hypothetical protein n=1 Tax=Streptomyces sp. NPDC048295 TaxID=3154617 RepID=UPI00343B28FF